MCPGATSRAPCRSLRRRPACRGRRRSTAGRPARAPADTIWIPRRDPCCPDCRRASPGGRLEILPTSGGGATPIEPKNGASFSETPGAELDTVGARLPAQQLEMRVGKVVRDDAAAGIERDDAEGMEELDCENPYLQRVSGLGALDEDRPGHRMGARAALGHTESRRPSALPESLSRLRPPTSLAAVRPRPSSRPARDRLRRSAAPAAHANRSSPNARARASVRGRVCEAAVSTWSALPPARPDRSRRLDA